MLQSNNRKVGPTPGYREWLHKLRKTCTDAGVLLIFDEAQSPHLSPSLPIFDEVPLMNERVNG